ncbi:competence type IV pilus minor pilin ComGD [Halalkalibacter urbisdiaboli]|uniref:competence type IV pilus minor pilin ComGD n=1 Tax=Halalkalibacter urbisdiaboli TaxID=1960589 RepID=UPI000B436276|nr:competence type IV pilus minor pilin ComGD [Halalkalibacter urbisdiaboli]
MTQNGYSLIELLISLSILSLLLIIPSVTLQSTFHSEQTEYIAYQIKEDLLLAQHIAITNGRTTSVYVDNQQNYYTIRFSTTEEYMRRAFQHDKIMFSAVTMGINDISFLPNGNPRKSGTIKVMIHDREFFYTIYLGKGRVYYREL